MNSQQIVLLIINIIGGILVVGSYIYGIKTHPQAGPEPLWGGVPVKMRNIYAVSMLLAGIGYFLFTFYILFKINYSEIKIANVFGYGLFQILYILILLPSACWMPLTYSMIENPKTVTWFLIRAALAIVALASLAILISLLFLSPQQSGISYWLAVGGISIFLFHTGILDALIWPFYFG